MAEAGLKLLEVRASELGYQGVWEDKYRTLPGLVMTDDQLRHAWSTTLKAMFKDEADDNEAKDEEAGLTNRQRMKKTMADSILGSFSDSDVKQRSGTFCVMDVQTIAKLTLKIGLFNAY